MAMRQRIDPSHLIPSTTTPSHTLPVISSQQSNPPFFPTSVMSGPSGSSRVREPFEAALVEYEQQTGIDLTKHPLSERLQDCNSVEDITRVLREQAQDIKKLREKDKVLKPLKKILTVLHLLSSVPGIAQHVGLVRPKPLTNIQCLRPSSYSLSGP